MIFEIICTLILIFFLYNLQSYDYSIPVKGWFSTVLVIEIIHCFFFIEDASVSMSLPTTEESRSISPLTPTPLTHIPLTPIPLTSTLLTLNPFFTEDALVSMSLPTTEESRSISNILEEFLDPRPGNSVQRHALRSLRVCR
jgi:hypothetical protein